MGKKQQSGQERGFVHRSQVPASILSILILFLFAGSIFLAQAMKEDVYEVAHEISYTQSELAALIEKSVLEPQQPDLSLLASNPGSFELEPDVSQADGAIAGSTHVEWINAELEGKTLIDTRIEEDGCIAYVAIDSNSMELYVFAINHTADIHAFNIRISERDDLSAETKNFTLEPVIVPVEKEIGAPESSPQSIVESFVESATSIPEELSLSPSSAIESESNLIASSSDIVDLEDNNENKEDVPPVNDNDHQAESPVAVFKTPFFRLFSSTDTHESTSSGSSSIQTTQPENAAQPTGEQQVVSGFTAELSDEESIAEVKSQVQVVVDGNGMGEIKLRLNYLVSGSKLDAIELKGAKIKDGGNTLRIYSAGDRLPNNGGVPNTNGYDFATWSGGSNFNTVYIINPSKPITVVNSSSSEESFSVELHNSNPVTIAGFDFTGFYKDIKNQLFVIAKKENATLTINNKNGYTVGTGKNTRIVYDGIDFPLSLTLHGKGILNIDANGLAITNSYKSAARSATLSILEGFAVNITAHEGGIGDRLKSEAEGMDSLIMDGNSSLNIEGKQNNHTGIAIDLNRKIELFNSSSININYMDFGIKSGFQDISSERNISVLNNSEIIIKNTNSGIYTLGSVISNNQSTIDINASGNDCIVINARNVAATQNSFVTVDGSNKANIGILASHEVYADGKSYIHSEFSDTAIECYTLATYDYNGSSFNSYAPLSAITDTNRTRIVGIGEDIGITVKGESSSKGVFAGTGTVVLAKGASRGMVAASQLSRSSGLPANSDIGHERYKNNGDNKAYATLFAIATDENGAGYEASKIVSDSKNNFDNGVRLVAIGGKYGFYTVDYSNAIVVENSSELIAIGDYAGVYMDCKGADILVETDGSLYAKGNSYGAYLLKGNVKVHNSKSKINGSSEGIFIGGIPDKDMSDNGNFDYLETFAFKDLPRPITDPITGLLQFTPPKDNSDPNNPTTNNSTSYGIFVGKGNHTVCYGLQSKMYSYGGTVGIEAHGGEGDKDNLNDVYCYYGGYIESHGGVYGIRAGHHVYSRPTVKDQDDEQCGRAVIKAFGGRIGIYARYDVHTKRGYDPARGAYIYGYGQEAGIYAGWHVSADRYGDIVAETVVDAAETNRNNPGAQAAIVAPKCDVIKIQSKEGALIHEIYTVKNMPIINQTPLTLNLEILSLGNMGLYQDMMYAFDWTTPKNPPVRDPNGYYDYLNYDVRDNLGLLRLDSINGKVGLVAVKDAEGATIIGNCTDFKASYRKYVTDNKSISSADKKDKNKQCKIDESGNGAYRITIKGETVKITDNRVMDVEIDLWERINDSQTQKIPKIPPSTVYSLSFKSNFSNEPVQTIELKNGKAEFLANEGKLRLKKLRAGEYTLKPIKDIGLPYMPLPEIKFVVGRDKNGLETLSIPNAVPATVAKVIDPSKQYSNPNDGKGTPTFTLPNGYPNNDAKRIGLMQVYYQRQSELQVNLQAKGLWFGHNLETFVIEIKGTSGAAKNQVFYDYVSIAGSTDYNTFTTNINSSSVSFSGIPEGSYTVTAYSSLRTLGSNNKNPVLTENVTIGSGQKSVTFSFDCSNLTYLSGTDADTNTFVVTE